MVVIVDVPVAGNHIRYSQPITVPIYSCAFPAGMLAIRTIKIIFVNFYKKVLTDENSVCYHDVIDREESLSCRVIRAGFYRTVEYG